MSPSSRPASARSPRLAMHRDVRGPKFVVERLRDASLVTARAAIDALRVVRRDEQLLGSVRAASDANPNPDVRDAVERFFAEHEP